MDLNDMVAKVNSKETFLEFVRALAADWEEEQKMEKASASNPFGPGARGWENGSIGAFLDGMQAWATDAEDKIPNQPTWKTFAELLRAGKYYE